jgi:hypothetical protein
MTTCNHCATIFKPKRKEQVYCSKSCASVKKGLMRSGQKTGLQDQDYKTRTTKDGHLRMYAAKHPFAEGRKEMHIHDMVMELHLGRRLALGEVVHHRDEVKTNNALDNLELKSHSLHSSEHMKEIVRTKPRDKGGRFA